LPGGGGFEADAAAAVGVGFDDVAILFLIQAGIPNLAAGQFVQLADGGFGDGQFGAFGVDEIEGVAIAADFFLVAVLEVGLAEDDGADAFLIDFNAFDAVGGDGTFDQRVFAEHFEALRGLPGVKLLLAEGFAQVRQVQACGGGDGGEGGGKLAEGHHEVVGSP